MSIGPAILLVATVWAGQQVPFGREHGPTLVYRPMSGSMSNVTQTYYGQPGPISTWTNDTGTSVSRDIRPQTNVGASPTFLGGSKEIDIYNSYLIYKKIIGEISLEEALHSRCFGGCPRYSYCQDGFCVCDPAHSVVQLYGRCFNDKTVKFVGDHDKYRKPTLRPRPEWCFCVNRCGKKMCQQHLENEECKIPEYPNIFHHNAQYCRRGDHNHCMRKDMNMICGEKKVVDKSDMMEKHVCECRQGMAFDTKSMECRIFINVDCTYEPKTPAALQSELARFLKGELEELDRDYSKAEAKTTFCNIIDSVAEKNATAWNPNVVTSLSTSLNPGESMVLILHSLWGLVTESLGYCPGTQPQTVMRDLLRSSSPTLYRTMIGIGNLWSDLVDILEHYLLGEDFWLDLTLDHLNDFLYYTFLE